MGDLQQLKLLQAEFTARGWHQKAAARVIGAQMLHSVLSFGGQAACLFSSSFPVKALGLLVSTYGTIGVTTHAHTASHGATSERRWVNRLMTLYGFTFFAGQSMTAWHNSHVVVHHRAPNVMGVDADADFSPILATTDRQIATSSAAKKKYLRHQWPILLLGIFFTVFIRQCNGLKFLLGRMRHRRTRRAVHWLDLGVVILHFAFWIGVPALVLGLQAGVAFYVLRICTMAYPLVAVLAPPHYPTEAVVVTQGDWQKDFLLLQTATTVNFRTGLLGRFLCAGLEYQIEHHLFPSYSHVYYRHMSGHVREFCECNGYPYRTIGWWEGCRKMFEIFIRPKHEFPNLAAVRRHFEPQRERQLDGYVSASE